MENTAGKIFTELKEDISTYARLKLRLLKLMAIERTAIVLAVLSHSLILLLLSFFTVLFLFVALGCYLGELLDSPALGFLIVGGFYLLFTLIVWGMKHGIRIGIMNMVIEALQANRRRRRQRSIPKPLSARLSWRSGRSDGCVRKRRRKFPLTGNISALMPDG